MSIQICTIERSLHISDLSRGKIDGFKATPPAEGFLLRYLGVSVMMNTIRKIADTVSYQYVPEMNYTVFTFEQRPSMGAPGISAG